MLTLNFVLKNQWFKILFNEWRQFDYYAGKEATLILPNEKITGILKGVDEQGSLLMLVDGKLLSYRSGEVSLRI